MVQLHYAKVDLDASQQDIPKFEFKDEEKMIYYIGNYIYDEFNDPKVVFLAAYKGEVFVTDSANSLVEFLLSFCDLAAMEEDEANIYLQEYYSFEAAYEVALMMKETSPLCYEPEEAKN